MAVKLKSTFKAQEKIDYIRQKSESSMEKALRSAIVDIQRRMDKGKGADGSSYKLKHDRYVGKGKDRKKIKSKGDIANWDETGLLRRSMDILVKIDKNKIRGFIGIKNLPRKTPSGKTVTNKKILEGLIKMFPEMWKLSKTEKKEAVSNFFRYFRG